MCFLATFSVVFSCCFSLLLFSRSDFSSFLDSEAFSFWDLSSNFSNTSLRAFTTLSISSWVISKSSNVFSARDKIRLSFSADFSVFLLISVFLILTTKSSNSFLLTSFLATSILAVDAPTISFAVIFSVLLLLELCVCFSFSSVGIVAFESSSSTLLFFSCLDTVSKPLTFPAYVTCGPLIFTAPTTKNSEQPKRMSLPFLTIRQFFCWSPCLLNNIFFLLLYYIHT